MKYVKIIYNIKDFKSLNELFEKVKADLEKDSTAIITLCADRQEYLGELNSFYRVIGR